ncbi:MAG TPA: zinc ribbon domain-containing protein [Pyrinomonadaceae bacterium]
MFCPSCGSEERQLSQFCRACGTDLRAVRAGLERPDAITNSAATARDEIGRAVAAKIRELQGPGELKTMASDVLPKLAEFLESPEEKRLKQMRAGVIVSAAGLGAMITFMLAAIGTGDKELLVPAAVFGVALFIGLAIIINAKLLTTQRKKIREGAEEASIKDALDQLPSSEPKALKPGQHPPSSVIEHTTHKLSSEPAVAQRRKPSIENES